MPLFCWFHHFLDSREEIVKFFFVGILVETMTPKGHFEINWPLAETIWQGFKMQINSDSYVLSCSPDPTTNFEFRITNSLTILQRVLFFSCSFFVQNILRVSFSWKFVKTKFGIRSRIRWTAFLLFFFITGFRRDSRSSRQIKALKSQTGPTHTQSLQPLDLP